LRRCFYGNSPPQPERQGGGWGGEGGGGLWGGGGRVLGLSWPRHHIRALGIISDDHNGSFGRKILGRKVGEKRLWLSRCSAEKHVPQAEGKIEEIAATRRPQKVSYRTGKQRDHHLAGEATCWGEGSGVQRLTIPRRA